MTARSSSTRRGTPPARRGTRWRVAALFLSFCWAPAGLAQPVDQRAPAVRLIDPRAGDLLRGAQSTELGAADAVLADRITSGSRRLELLVDGEPFGRIGWPRDRERVPWNSHWLRDGGRSISAAVVDTAGNRRNAAARRVRVDNTPAAILEILSPSRTTLPAKGTPPDTTAPWVLVTAPAADQPVRDRVVLEAFAVDDAYGSGLATVAFTAGGGALGNAAAAGRRFRLTWDTTAVGDGPRAISATATDRRGNSASATPISVVVDNRAPRLDRVRASPPVLRNGTMTVYVHFDEEHGMDEGVAPNVRLTLPGGGNRTVQQQRFFGERGLWIGTVAVDRAADGAGAGVISVRDARDRAGNPMAAVARAATFQLVAANPVPPIAGSTILNDLGISYRYGAPGARRYRVHEGVDYQGAPGTRVNAVRAGRIEHVDPAGTDRTVAVRVQVGASPGGGAIFERDVYLHLDNPVAVGTDVGVGDRIGDVGNNYAAGFNHTHHYWGPTINGNGYPRPRRNPLFNFLQVADRDPEQSEPAVREGGGDGRTIYLRRRHDDALLPTPANPVYGEVRIQAELADRMNHVGQSYPLELGYWIEPRETLGQGVREARAPYLLAHWYEYDVRINDLGDLERYVTRNPSTSWPGFVWRRYHHAWLSNAAALDGTDAHRQAAQFWHAGARDDSGARDNGSDGAAARASAEARFRDGRYWLHVTASDLRRTLLDLESSAPGTWAPDHYDDAQPNAIVVDNFAPHLVRVTVEQGTDRLRRRYDARWELVGGAQRLQPPRREERNPRWVNGRADLEIRAHFSEPLSAAPNLVLRRQGGIKRVAMTAGPASAGGAFTATIARSDPDLARHRLDLADGRRFAFEATDLAGNAIDSDPSTIALRSAATGAFAGHEAAADGDFGGAVVDKTYRVRIDTKHDRKAAPPSQLQAGGP